MLFFLLYILLFTDQKKIVLNTIMKYKNMGNSKSLGIQNKLKLNQSLNSSLTHDYSLPSSQTFEKIPNPR